MFGLDHLGLAKYGKLAAAEHPAGWAIGCFSNVSGFGDALPALKLVLDTGRCPRVRIHLYWSGSHAGGDFPGCGAGVSRCAETYPLRQICLCHRRQYDFGQSVRH